MLPHRNAPVKATRSPMPIRITGFKKCFSPNVRPNTSRGSPDSGRLQVFPSLEGASLAGRKVAFRVEPAEDLDKLRNGASPAGLVAGSQACSVVTIEVLEEEKVVPPMGIALELLRGAVNRTAAGFVAQENAGQPGSNFTRHFEQVHPNTGAGGTLDFEIVAIVKIER